MTEAVEAAAPADPRQTRMSLYWKWVSIALTLWGGWILSVSLLLLNQKAVGQFALVLTVVLTPVLSIWLTVLRCRRCGALVSKKERGVFGLHWVVFRAVLPPKRCPMCGVDLRDQR